MKKLDVAVIGAGPAGSSSALRLAQLGVDVALFGPEDGSRQHVGESLPSSIRAVFATLGLELPGDVLVPRPPEHLVYWGEMEGGRPWSDIPEGETSLLVWRGLFDRFLRAKAAAHVRVVSGPVRRVERISDDGFEVEAHSGVIERARVVVDATGRSGLLARHLRRKESRFRTLALTGHFLTEEASPPTIVEAFADGWVWSSPLENGLRDVTVMVDAPAEKEDRERLYRRALEGASRIGSLVEGSAPSGPVRGIDATPYDAREFCGADFFLVGDAASFLDPLSAHGVHKAMDSALAAAASIRTILKRPERARDAVGFYDTREGNIARITTERMTALYRKETRFPASSFWRRRSEGEVPPAPEARRRPPLGANDALRASPSVRLEEAPVLEDDFIERREVLVAPGQDRPVRFLGPLCLPDLYREVLAAPSASEAARRSPFGFDRAFAAIEWLYRAGYLERRDLDEL